MMKIDIVHGYRKHPVCINIYIYICMFAYGLWAYRCVSAPANLCVYVCACASVCVRERDDYIPCEP